MLKRFRVGSVFGIPIEVDVTLLFVVPLIVWGIATNVAGVVDLLAMATGVQLELVALTAGNWPLVLGALGATGLFASVALHELGHSVVAMREGYEIESIGLWFLGGIAQFEDDPEEWTDELKIALAGPAVSVVLGVVGVAVLVAAPASVPRLRFIVGYLGVLNVVLAGFNLLPGFPMDGGRVLRALLSRNRSLTEATDLAAGVGKVVAVCLGFAGVIFANLILVAIGVFVYLGASAEATQTRLRSAFEDTTVGDLMTPADALRTVSPGTSVDRLFDRMYKERHTGYPVCADGDVLGIVTLEDVSDVDEETAGVTVEAVMSTDLVTVSPDTAAFDALEEMEQNGVGRLPVTDEGGELVGLVSRTDLMTALAIARKSPQVGSLPAGRSGLAGD